MFKRINRKYFNLIILLILISNLYLLTFLSPTYLNIDGDSNISDQITTEPVSLKSSSTIESTRITKETQYTNDFTVNMPSVRPDGDLYIAQIAIDVDTTFSTIPSGWTEIENDIRDGPGSDVRFASYWKIGSSEPATYIWSSYLSVLWIGAIHRISGFDLNNPIHTSNVLTGMSANPTAPSVNTTIDDCLILRMFGADNDRTVPTYWPSGTTPIFQEDLGFNSVMSAAAYHNQSLAGSTGTAQFTMEMNEKWVAITIAIRPEAEQIPPTFSNLIESADPLELGETETIRINTSDPSGINQVLIEFEGSNHSMTHVSGDMWQYDSWTPSFWTVYQYKIYMEDNSGNSNVTSGNITVQDTTPPSPPIITYAPSGDVSGVLTFDWIDGSDPSGISFYILLIDNESDPYITPGYVFMSNITNVGPESSYFKLHEVIPPGSYYFFLIQIDGVGHQSSYSVGTFSMISVGNGNNQFMPFVIIGIIFASVIGSITTIVIVKRKIQKDSLPRRKKIQLKIILSHIDNISDSSQSSEKIAIQKVKKQKENYKVLPQKESIDDKELMARINKIKIYGESLFNEGAYLEAQKQFEIAEKILLKLGKKEEALLFSDLTIEIKELSEERDKKLETLEEAKLGNDSLKIFEIYYDLIEFSKKLKDYDSASMYLSELTQFYKTDKIKLRDLEYQRFNLYKQANSLIEENKFEKSAELYEKCEKISQFLVQIGRENEKDNVEKFREKIKDCLNKASQK